MRDRAGGASELRAECAGGGGSDAVEYVQAGQIGLRDAEMLGDQVVQASQGSGEVSAGGPVGCGNRARCI